ncbi:MAG: hypothetical protein ACOY93_02765 [Bacillota bacterium]
MSLMLAATEAGLAQRIRNRIAEGAPIRETVVDENPAWLVTEVGDVAVKAIFQSEHAHVAILEDGRAIVRRARF